MEKPTVIEVFNDNGSHSHWALVDSETSEKLWSENPLECKAMGYPVENKEINDLRSFNSAVILKIDELVKTANSFIRP